MYCMAWFNRSYTDWRPDELESVHSEKDTSSSTIEVGLSFSIRNITEKTPAHAHDVIDHTH